MKCKQLGGSAHFRPTKNFFFFLVGRNSASFAPARLRKSFASWQLLCGGGAKRTRFRPGGGTKLSPGWAKLDCTAISDFGFRVAQPLRFAALSDVQNSPTHTFGHLRRFGTNRWGLGARVRTGRRATVARAARSTGGYWCLANS